MFKEYSNLILSDNERAKLKAEFDQLETIDQKYDFWKDRFDFDYSQHYSLEQLSIEDFKIIPKSPLETEEINKRLYNDYVLFFGNGKNDSPENWKVLFIESISKSINKEACVELELNRIDDYFFSLKHPQQRKKSFGVGYVSTKSASEWFFLGFEQYLINRKEFDWSEKLYHPKVVVDILIGIEWAKYKEFVRTYLKPEKTKPKMKLTGEQQVLALLYLGLGKDIETDVQKGELYEYFIENFKHKSILKVFSNISDFENEKNLDILIDFFRSLKINAIARELEDKLENLKQKRTRK